MANGSQTVPVPIAMARTANFEAGVCGEKGEGAYSIVLANAGYADEDFGEVSFFHNEYHDCLNPFNR